MASATTAGIGDTRKIGAPRKSGHPMTRERGKVGARPTPLPTMWRKAIWKGTPSVSAGTWGAWKCQRALMSPPPLGNPEVHKLFLRNRFSVLAMEDQTTELEQYTPRSSLRRGRGDPNWIQTWPTGDPEASAAQGSAPPWVNSADSGDGKARRSQSSACTCTGSSPFSVPLARAKRWQSRGECPEVPI